MKTQNAIRLSLAAVGAATLLFSPLLQSGVKAQGPGGPGGNGGQGGGFNRRSPYAMGTVSAVDAAAGTITVASQFGGGSQTIQTSGTTQIVSQAAASVSDLKTGDKVQVQGIPTGITASSLTIGQPPVPTGGPGRNGGPGGPGGPGAPRGGGPGGMRQSFAMASGTVTSTSPLTLSLSDSASLTLKLDPAAKVTKFTTITLGGIKVGDRVAAMGQTGDDGTLTATMVGVNVDMGGMGMGQRGGPGGGFGGRGGRGRGGRGGPGGGFGGPGGGPGGQGGGFGGPDGGGPGGPPPPDQAPPPVE